MKVPSEVVGRDFVHQIGEGFGRTLAPDLIIPETPANGDGKCDSSRRIPFCPHDRILGQ